MVVQLLSTSSRLGCRQAMKNIYSGGGDWWGNHREVTIPIRAWQGRGESTQGGGSLGVGAYIDVGLTINYQRSRMQDLANPDPLPLVQNPWRLISLFTIASRALPTTTVPKGAVHAQCARSATIWASSRTGDPYFVILGASLLALA